MERLAVISDIHANLPALEAVLDEIAGAGIRRVICLGDIVGYGPHPKQCLALVRERCDVVIKGNHDHDVVTGNMDKYNVVPAETLRWTEGQLSADEKNDLAANPDTAQFMLGRRLKVSVAHGSFARSDREAYVMPDSSLCHSDSSPAEEAAAGLTGVVLLGHTHVRYLHDRGKTRMLGDHGCREPFLVSPEGVSVINPGSVGKYRDFSGSGLASGTAARYVVLEDDGDAVRVHFRETSYDPDPVFDALEGIGYPYDVLCALWSF